MALITCKDCQREFSSDVKCCPNCGAKKPKADKTIITCKKCKKEFSRNEKRCPHCGARKPLSTGVTIFLVLAGLTALGAITSKNDDFNPVTGKMSPDFKKGMAESVAKDYCKKAVLKALNDPDSAQFDDVNVNDLGVSELPNATLDTHLYSVVFAGRARNGFNALHKIQITCTIEATDHSYRVIGVNEQ